MQASPVGTMTGAAQIPAMVTGLVQALVTPAIVMNPPRPGNTTGMQPIQICSSHHPGGDHQGRNSCHQVPGMQESPFFTSKTSRTAIRDGGVGMHQVHGIKDGGGENLPHLRDQAPQLPMSGNHLRPSMLKSSSAPHEKWSMDHNADSSQKLGQKPRRSSSLGLNTAKDTEPRNSLQAKLSMKASKIIDDVLKGGTGKNLALEEVQTSRQGC